MSDLKFTTAGDYVMDQQYEMVKTSLQEGIVEVKFTKVNGEERTMLATLNDELIPMDLRPTDDYREKNPEVQPVYDVEADGWRSFRWDSLISWDIA